MSQTIRGLLGFLLVAVLSSIPAWGLPAQAESAQAKDQLPFGDLFSAQEISGNFSPHQFTPLGNSKLAFEILVPKGWESHLSDIDPDQLTQDNQSPVGVVDFEPSQADDVGINILYQRVSGDVALDKFMDDYAKGANGKLVVKHKLDYKGRSFEEGLMGTTDDSLGPMVNRVAVLRQGDIVLIFSGWSVEEKYEKFKRTFGAVLASFNPTGK